jgi:hypothetical protein
MRPERIAALINNDSEKIKEAKLSSEHLWSPDQQSNASDVSNVQVMTQNHDYLQK